MENIILEYKQYKAEIYERTEIRKYPSRKFAVKYIQNTPKAKYSTYKILSHYVYKTLEEAKTAAEKWINNIKSNIERKNKDKEEQRARNKEATADQFYKIGDIIVNTWGYDQTNVEFYQVTEIKNKSIFIKEIGQDISEGSMMGHGMACDVIPDINNFLDNGDSYLLRVKAEGILSNPESFYYMHKWNGKPQYKSWYA